MNANFNCFNPITAHRINTENNINDVANNLSDNGLNVTAFRFTVYFMKKKFVNKLPIEEQFLLLIL